MKVFDEKKEGCKAGELVIRGRDALPFFASLVFGLAAHTFMLTNKIPVDDDICNFFNKGATTVSGRYGLELLRLVMPDVSMPWIYGVMSLLLIAAAVCLIVRIFDIQSKVMQVLLSAVFISFPAETGTLSYMFTCAPYALALLMAVSAVYVFSSGVRGRWIISPLLLIFSCSIYQGYFAFASGFCVLLLVKFLLERDKSTGEIMLRGVKMLAMLLLSAGLYGVTVLIAGKLAGVPVLDVVNKEQSLPMRIAVAYSAYLHTIFSGYFGYVRSGASRAMHVIVIAFTAICMAASILPRRDVKRTLLLLVCLFLLPLSCYCLYMLADNGYIHSLALYPFAVIYVLAAMVMDNFIPERASVLRTAVGAAMVVIIAGNIYFANSFYLKSYLQYENTKAFYSTVLAQAMQTEGFDKNTKLAIIGERELPDYGDNGALDFSTFQLPGNNIMRTTHAQDIIKNYLGCDIAFADEAECEEIRSSAEFSEMPVFPYYGSVKNDGGTVVVKLS